MEYLEKNIKVISEICDRIIPGKKKLQKLMYLIERKGVNLNLNYSMHFFGPYSSKLDNYIHELESLDLIDIEVKGSTHNICFNQQADLDIPLEEQECNCIDFVLNNFGVKTALELEAITTLDYVARVLLNSKGQDDQIIQNVKRIKGSKFTEEYLTNELDFLKQMGYLQAV